MKKQIGILIDTPTKEELVRIAKSERRSMTSLVLALIDDKIRETKIKNEKSN